MGNLELRTRIEAETGIRFTTNDITTIAGFGRAPLRKARARGGRRVSDDMRATVNVEASKPRGLNQRTASCL